MRKGLLREVDRPDGALRAAAADRTGVARLLVHLGADPDALDERHDTPWLVTGSAAAWRWPRSCCVPTRTSASSTGSAATRSSPPRSVAAWRTSDVAGTGIDADHVNDLGWTALLEAVILGDGSRRYQQVVRALLEAGADPTLADRDG